jgi:outer membrane protein OmpA-like peptidoglycan-associated protein
LRVTATSALFGGGHSPEPQPEVATRSDAPPSQPAPAPEPEQPTAETPLPAEAAPAEVPAPKAPPAEPPAPEAQAEPVSTEPAAPADDALFEKTLLFESNAVQLSPAARSTLDALVDALQAHPSTRLGVEGYSDATGPEEWNQVLSAQRAQAVRDYLVGHGIDGARLQLNGFGEADPAQPNGTPEGRAANRRVELHPAGAAR